MTPQLQRAVELAREWLIWDAWDGEGKAPDLPLLTAADGADELVSSTIARALLAIAPVAEAAERHAAEWSTGTMEDVGALYAASDALVDAVEQMRKELGNGP